MPHDITATLQGVKALTFDLMGTCTDWHKSITAALMNIQPPLPQGIEPAALATDWRKAFFDFILSSFERVEQSPDIDTVHRRTLDHLLSQRGVDLTAWGDAARNEAVAAWHKQLAWSDAVEGISRLKQKFDVVVLANGSTRLQLDIVSSSGLPFHALFSSQLLGHTKPDPRMYKRCIELLKLEPHQVCMVAAHAYDLRAASSIVSGMRTVYIHRDTEDPVEDMGIVAAEVDVFLSGQASKGNRGGIMELATLTECT